VLTNGPIDLFSRIHDEQFLIAFAIIGAITVLVVVVLVVLRSVGDIFEEFCNLRRRCFEARKRLRQGIESG
jgi:hypothetical protein